MHLPSRLSRHSTLCERRYGALVHAMLPSLRGGAQAFGLGSMTVSGGWTRVFATEFCSTDPDLAQKLLLPLIRECGRAASLGVAAAIFGPPGPYQRRTRGAKNPMAPRQYGCGEERGRQDEVRPAIERGKGGRPAAPKLPV
jgi:hypothetical protein